MINNHIPNEIEEVIIKEPFNWIPIIIIGLIGLGIIVIIITIIIMRKHHNKKYREYYDTEEMRKSKNNQDKIICLPFKQFHDYYSINPDNYILEYAKVKVKNPEYDEKNGDPWYKKYSYTIIFNFKEYKKYRKWIETSTNGMNDPAAIIHTLKFLEMVQNDIQSIRNKEAEAISQSQKTMMEFAQQLKSEFSLPENNIIDIRKSIDSSSEE